MMVIGPVLIKFADVSGHLSLIERDQTFSNKFNKLGQSARHGLCGTVGELIDLLLISGLLSPFKRAHWLPEATPTIVERENQAIKSGEHTHRAN